MRPLALTPEQEALIDAEARGLREMMQSDGWKTLSRLFKSTVELYDSTQGIKTLKELLARQDALAMMNAWMEAVVQRVARLEGKENMRRTIERRRADSGIVTIEEEGTEDEAS